MKLKSLIVAFLITTATSAFAQWYPGGWFPGTVQVSVLPLQVAAQVSNPYYAPIVCAGQVFGQTAQGPVFTAFFGQQIIPAGQFRLAFVQTNPWAPFVYGWTNINCRYF